ncbi:MAG: response regulator [Vulcanimicrobiota bacterium]
MHSLLVLDDDPQMLSSLSDVLQSSGYTVACASSSQEAIQKIGANPDKFDLVVADVRMDGMDGLEAVKSMVDLNPRLRSIIVTGYASEDAPGRAMDVDSCDYLRKPFTADQLLVSVSRALKPEPPGFMQKARAAAQSLGVAMTGLENLRDRVFQWYYLGIRSGHLGAAPARAIWEWLEATEWERLNAEKDLSLLAAVPELKKGYEKVGFLCKNPGEAQRPREEGISRVEFQPFFKNIQAGEISCEQLKTAVYLRSLPPSELSGELADLNQKIWNELKL